MTRGLSNSQQKLIQWLAQNNYWFAPLDIQKILTSSILGFGRTTMTVTVDDTQTTAKAFVLLIFVVGVQ